MAPPQECGECHHLRGALVISHKERHKEAKQFEQRLSRQLTKQEERIFDEVSTVVLQTHRGLLSPGAALHLWAEQIDRRETIEKVRRISTFAQKMRQQRGMMLAEREILVESMEAEREEARKKTGFIIGALKKQLQEKEAELVALRRDRLDLNNRLGVQNYKQAHEVASVRDDLAHCKSCINMLISEKRQLLKERTVSRQGQRKMEAMRVAAEQELRVKRDDMENIVSKLQSNCEAVDTDLFLTKTKMMYMSDMFQSERKVLLERTRTLSVENRALSDLAKGECVCQSCYEVKEKAATSCCGSLRTCYECLNAWKSLDRPCAYCQAESYAIVKLLWLSLGEE